MACSPSNMKNNYLGLCVLEGEKAPDNESYEGEGRTAVLPSPS